MANSKLCKVFKFAITLYVFMSLYIILNIHSSEDNHAKLDTYGIPFRVLHQQSFDVIKHFTNKLTTSKERRKKPGKRTGNAEEIKQDIVLGRERVPLSVKTNKLHGPGELGTEIKIPDSVNRTQLAELLSSKYGFNLYLSDLIGTFRSFGDSRPQKCRNQKFPNDLPAASVVIVFRNEYPSILLRTAYSVLRTAPRHLLEDIVLVDDGSDDDDLNTAVDIHVANVEKFHLVRNRRSLGLMGARQRGIEAARSGYFIVLDSRMEVEEGWMEPILFRLLQEPKALVSPVIDEIHGETLKRVVNERFDNKFMYMNQITLTQTFVPYNKNYVNTRNGSVEPLTYPIMQGMAMAMKKDFFFQLGGFDVGMRVLESGQMELSVKVWLCGGFVEVIPCSRVGHLSPANDQVKTLDYIKLFAYNRARFAEVWLEGEHRNFVLDHQYKKGAIRASDFVIRKMRKEQNKCKPYRYFLEQVKKLANIYIPENALAVGQIYNNISKLCLGNTLDKYKNHTHVGGHLCRADDDQYFVWTEKFQMRFADYILLGNGTELLTSQTVLEVVHPATIFNYKTDNTIVHNESQLCITVVDKYLVNLQNCVGSREQVWEWKRLRPSPDIIIQ